MPYRLQVASAAIIPRSIPLRDVPHRRILASLVNCSAPRRYPHDMDGVADDIGGAFLALGSLGHGATVSRLCGGEQGRWKSWN